MSPSLRRRGRCERPTLVLLLAIGLAGALGCVNAAPPKPARPSSDVQPVPLGTQTAGPELTERLTRWIDGSRAWNGDRAAGTWSATQQGEDEIVAELDWDRFYLRTEVSVNDDEVEIVVTESEGLGESGGRIAERAAAHLRTLRRTIRTALRTDDRRDAASPTASRPASLPPRPALPAGALTPELLGGYHALVIGNDRYHELQSLRTAVADAEAVAGVLRDEYGFQVTLLRNASRSEIVSALHEQRRVLDERDNLLVYYAGHGWFDEQAQRGYWQPVDASPDDPSEWVSNATITDMLRAMPAKHVMVVADSCYSGTLTRGIRAVPRGDHWSRLASQRARTALTSGGLEPVEDGAGRHSVFAAAFVRTLRENDGLLDGQSLYTNLRRSVVLDSDQTPTYSDIRRAGHEGGDFLFVPRR